MLFPSILNFYMEQAVSHKKKEVNGSLRLQEARAIWHYRVLQKLPEAWRQTTGPSIPCTPEASSSLRTWHSLKPYSGRHTLHASLNRDCLLRSISKLVFLELRTERFQIEETKSFNQLKLQHYVLFVTDFVSLKLTMCRHRVLPYVHCACVWHRRIGLHLCPCQACMHICTRVWTCTHMCLCIRVVRAYAFFHVATLK